VVAIGPAGCDPEQVPDAAAPAVTVRRSAVTGTWSQLRDLFPPRQTPQTLALLRDRRVLAAAEASNQWAKS
jgi:hypothetical protein